MIKKNYDLLKLDGKLSELEDVLNDRELFESSLTRVLQHVKRGQHEPWAILTSWRDETEKDRQGNPVTTRAENEANFKRLQADLRSQGHGFFHLVGFGRQLPNEPTGKGPEVSRWAKRPGEEIPAEAGRISYQEPSLFVPGLSRKYADRIVRRFGQWGYIYGGPDTAGEVHIVYTDGRPEENIGEFHAMNVARAYSELRGRPFVFESWQVGVTSWLEAVHDQAMSRKQSEVGR